jgi:uncharacterized protein (TIGR04255 family)
MGTPPGTPPYESDTLRYVALEVRYPPVEVLAAPAPPASLREDLRPTFPVYDQVADLNLNLVAGAPAAQQVIRHRFFTRDRLAMITVSRDGLTLETTSYPGWSTFRDQFRDLVGAVAASSVPDGVLRIGLRYIDEIRVPNLSNTAEWSEWIDPRLAAPLSLYSQPPSTGQISLQYGEAPGYLTVFRAAPVPHGRTVQAQGPLRLPFETPDGPYFLLDTDSSWVDPERQVPEFDVERIVGIAEELHAPCIELYEASIGGRLRSEVLNQPRRPQGATQ